MDKEEEVCERIISIINEEIVPFSWYDNGECPSYFSTFDVLSVLTRTLTLEEISPTAEDEIKDIVHWESWGANCDKDIVFDKFMHMVRENYNSEKVQHYLQIRDNGEYFCNKVLERFREKFSRKKLKGEKQFPSTFDSLDVLAVLKQTVPLYEIYPGLEQHLLEMLEDEVEKEECINKCWFRDLLKMIDEHCKSDKIQDYLKSK